VILHPSYFDPNQDAYATIEHIFAGASGAIAEGASDFLRSVEQAGHNRAAGRAHGCRQGDRQGRPHRLKRNCRATARVAPTLRRIGMASPWRVGATLVVALPLWAVALPSVGGRPASVGGRPASAGGRPASAGGRPASAGGRPALCEGDTDGQGRGEPRARPARSIDV
jgi:hypothetical protein